jgi:hypothetical protein
MDRLLDILLFPKELYKRITDKKPSLYAGIIFIGLIDLSFILYRNFDELFINKVHGDLIFNIFLSIIVVAAIGIIDVMFFTLPMFDLFKRFKKNKNLSSKFSSSSNKDILGLKNVKLKGQNIEDKNLLIRLMKVYIITHFLILPAEIAIIMIYKNLINDVNIVTWVIYISAIIDLAIPIWFGSAITRGTNVLYTFNPIFKRLVFLIVFVWNHLLSYALSYMIDKWILILFR